MLKCSSFRSSVDPYALACSLGQSKEDSGSWLCSSAVPYSLACVSWRQKIKRGWMPHSTSFSPFSFLLPRLSKNHSQIVFLSFYTTVYPYLLSVSGILNSSIDWFSRLSKHGKLWEVLGGEPPLSSCSASFLCSPK